MPHDAQSRCNDAAAYLRGLAQMRGRNADWAERAVREAVSLTAEEALKQKRDRPRRRRRAATCWPSSTAAASRCAGRASRLRREAAVDRRRARLAQQRLLAVITNPSVALHPDAARHLRPDLRVHQPGLRLPGVVGAICLLLALYALQLLPVNYAGLALIAARLA